MVCLAGRLGVALLLEVPKELYSFSLYVEAVWMLCGSRKPISKRFYLGQVFRFRQDSAHLTPTSVADLS